MKRSPMKRRKPMKPGRASMKRTPIANRKASLKRGKPLSRATRLKARPGGSRFPKRRHPEYRRWIRAQPCILTQWLTAQRLTANDLGAGPGFWRHLCWGPIDPAHVGEKQSRGAYDLGRVVPLDRAAHRFYDEHRREWEAVTGLTEALMENLAGGYALKWVERGGTL